MKTRFKIFISIFLGCFLFSLSSFAENPNCPGSDAPPPPVLKADLPQLISALEQLKDTKGNLIWKSTPESLEALKGIFDSTPSKTKLEQFFQLLFLLQKNIDPQNLPVVVNPPGITQVLLAAKVFTDPSFPEKIIRVELKKDGSKADPLYVVSVAQEELRFAVNQGHGFASWEEGMCQIAKELIFSNGFSFRVRSSRANQNLIVEDFDKVQIYGQFGTRKLFDIDLNYLDLERVEFIQGTDQGKVKARVAKREFKENKHSSLFKWIGSLIPNTSKQRIDW